MKFHAKLKAAQATVLRALMIKHGPDQTSERMAKFERAIVETGRSLGVGRNLSANLVFITMLVDLPELIESPDGMDHALMAFAAGANTRKRKAKAASRRRPRGKVEAE